MTITFTWASTTDGIAVGTFVLAQSPDPIPMTNLKVNGSRLIQKADLFRATAGSSYDRGNRRTEVTFETTRLFADQQTAETFLLQHETMFPGTGLVNFTSGSGSGTFNCYLIAAVVETVQSAISGCTTKHSYKISGGVMSLTSS